MRAKLLGIVIVCTACCASGVVRGEDAYTVAARKYAAGDYAAASQDFEVLLQQQARHPRASDARFYLAEAKLQLEDLDAARAHYAEFLKLAAPAHPLRRHALLHHGEASLMSGAAAEAKPILEQFLREFAKDEFAPTAQLRLAQALEALGELDPALKLYSALAQPGGEQSWLARLGAGRVLYRAGRHAQASRMLTAVPWPEEASVASEAAYWTALAWMAEQRPQEAVELIDQVLERHPNLAGADMLEYCAGLAWQQAGDRAAATERFERLGRQFPESRWGEVALKCRVQLTFETGDFEQAHALAEGFLETYAQGDHREMVLQYRARIETKLRRFKTAETTFRELIANAEGKTGTSTAKPILGSHWFYLAEAQISRGAHAEGLKTLAKAQQVGLPAEFAAEVAAAKAIGLVGLKRTDEAIALLTQWLQVNAKRPDAGVCRARLALAQAAGGKWQAAQSGLERWFTTQPEDPQSLLTMNSVAEMAYRQGNFPVALNCFERLSSDDVPEAYQAEGLAGAALTRFAMGDHANSASTWEQLLRDHPSYPLAAQASFQRGKALERSDNHEAAIAAYRQTAAKYPQTDEAPQSLAAAAKLAAANEKDAEAAECYQDLVGRYPEFSGRDAALAQWATLLDRAGKVDAADEVWLRLETEHPQSQVAKQALIRSAHVAVKRNTKEAAELVARVQEASDEATRLQATYLEGKLAANAGEWPKVAELMEQVIEASPNADFRLEASYWLAEAAFQQNQWEVAKQRFELLDADSGSREDAWLARVPLRRAQILLHEREWEAAVELASQVTQRFPQFREGADVKLVLGHCYAGLRRYEEARQEASSVFRVDSKAPAKLKAAAELLFADTLAAEGRFEEALPVYEQIAEYAETPSTPLVLLQLGKCLESLNRADEAVNAYKRLIATNDTSSFTAEAERRMKAAEQRLAAEPERKLR